MRERSTEPSNGSSRERQSPDRRMGLVGKEPIRRSAFPGTPSRFSLHRPWITQRSSTADFLIGLFYLIKEKTLIEFLLPKRMVELRTNIVLRCIMSSF